MNIQSNQALTPLDIASIMTDMLNEPAPFTEGTHDLISRLYNRLYDAFGKNVMYTAPEANERGESTVIEIDIPGVCDAKGGDVIMVPMLVNNWIVLPDIHEEEFVWSEEFIAIKNDLIVFGSFFKEIYANRQAAYDQFIAQVDTRKYPSMDI
jgi:hypothetical protein